MKCFYHIDRDAVGLCKFCNKGLCPECVIDTGVGLACQGKDCQDQVKMLDELTHRSQQAMDNTANAYRTGAILYSILGLLMLIPGGLLTLKGNSVALLLDLLALLFFFSAVMNFLNSRRFKK